MCNQDGWLSESKSSTILFAHRSAEHSVLLHPPLYTDQVSMSLNWQRKEDVVDMELSRIPFPPPGSHPCATSRHNTRTDRLFSRLVSGHGVLKWLRTQDVLHTRFTRSPRNERTWDTLWVHTVFWHCCMHRLLPCMSFVSFSEQRAGSACAASSNPISFLFWKSAAWLYVSLVLFKSLTTFYFINMEHKELSFTTSWRFLLPPSLRIVSFLSLLSPLPHSDYILDFLFCPLEIGPPGPNLSRVLANLIWLIQKSAGQLSGSASLRAASSRAYHQNHCPFFFNLSCFLNMSAAASWTFCTVNCLSVFLSLSSLSDCPAFRFLSSATARKFGQ